MAKVEPPWLWNKNLRSYTGKTRDADVHSKTKSVIKTTKYSIFNLYPNFCIYVWGRRNKRLKEMVNSLEQQSFTRFLCTDTTISFFPGWTSTYMCMYSQKLRNHHARFVTDLLEYSAEFCPSPSWNVCFGEVIVTQQH